MIIVWFALFSSSLPIAHHDKEDGGDIVPKIWIMERKNIIMFIDSCQWFSSKGWNWLGSSPRPRLLMLTIGCRCRCASWQRRWRRRQGGGRTHRAWSGPGRGREPEEVLFMDISQGCRRFETSAFFSEKINISTTGGFRVGFFQPDTNHP